MTKANDSAMKNDKKPHKKPMKEIRSISDLRDRHESLVKKEKKKNGSGSY